MIPDGIDRTLVWVGAGHLVIGVVCLGLLGLDAALVTGVHPAWKPAKFGLSIAAFLLTMAVVLPTLSLGPALLRALGWTLALTMIAEMMPILWQAARGTTSHFNSDGAFNAALWKTMLIAIVLATLAMLGIAAVATLRPLRSTSAQAMGPLMATAWRAALWFFLLAAYSGFAMGGRSQHSVGGPDGGPGRPITNWSVTHGDLRVSHFVALHALQTLPLIGALLQWLPISSVARWTAMIVAIGLHVLIALATLLQALAGRPL